MEADGRKSEVFFNTYGILFPTFFLLHTLRRVLAAAWLLWPAGREQTGQMGSVPRRGERIFR